MMSDARQAPGLPSFPLLSPRPRGRGHDLPWRQAVGMDLVALTHIEDSLRDFGVRFLDRIFTKAEQAYACGTGEFDALRVARLGARFAAKEAALKALGLADCGVAWRDIEVQREASGAVSLVLHGGAGTLTREAGLLDTALSLSHDGAYAAAIVVARFRGDARIASPH